MNKVKLGRSDLMVSEVCLGSMTWGVQNTSQDGFEQIDYALDQGINFIDTAEMYPVPPSKDTQGDTEKIIGMWLSQNPTKRQDIVLATKITGSGVPWVRGGGPLNAQAIFDAVDGSLERLQTDYIDLYQIHWPNRKTPHFSKHWPGFLDHSETDVAAEKATYLEVLQALDECIKAGKIKHIGVSNDTPWGVCEWLKLSEIHQLPRIVSVQNEFSLIHLKDWPHLIETCVHEEVAYLPWSPLAGGALSGKYADGQKPDGARWTMVQRNGIFRDTTYSHEAIAALREVAEANDLSLTQMSLAWVFQLQGITSSIIGATSMEQLKEDIGAYQVSLSDQLIADILAVIKRYPMPF